jgi:hypothetical protein
MTEPREEVRRITRTVEVIFYIVAVPVVLGLLFVLARFIRWAADQNYHMFRR